MHKRRTGTVTAMVIVLASLAGAQVWGSDVDNADAEITALIDQVAASGCVFIRNARQYDAAAAASHLRLKYRRGKRYADTAEHFIDRLASKSSLSGKLYYMQCADEPRIETREWLRSALQRLRS